MVGLKLRRRASAPSGGIITTTFQFNDHNYPNFDKWCNDLLIKPNNNNKKYPNQLDIFLFDKENVAMKFEYCCEINIDWVAGAGASAGNAVNRKWSRHFLPLTLVISTADMCFMPRALICILTISDSFSRVTGHRVATQQQRPPTIWITAVMAFQSDGHGGPSSGGVIS